MNTVVQPNAGGSGVDPIALWPLPAEPSRLMLCWPAAGELTTDAIQVRATTVTTTLEEILSWHGRQPEANFQIELAKWEQSLREPGVLHGGINE